MDGEGAGESMNDCVRAKGEEGSLFLRLLVGSGEMSLSIWEAEGELSAEGSLVAVSDSIVVTVRGVGSLGALVDAGEGSGRGLLFFGLGVDIDCTNCEHRNQLYK